MPKLLAVKSVGRKTKVKFSGKPGEILELMCLLFKAISEKTPIGRDAWLSIPDAVEHLGKALDPKKS